MKAAPALVQAQLKDFTINHGLVHYHGLVYVPDNDEIKCTILQLYHDLIPAGHSGQANTLALIMQNYYWPRMSEFMRCYVDGCKMCQRIKPCCQRPHRPLQPLEVPNGPWQHIFTDYIGLLLMSQGFNAIQVVCNKSTKRAHFLLAHFTDSTAAMCNTFLERVWCLHKMPKKVISDRGPQFVAQYVKQMWECLGIKQVLSMVHYPQTNGQTEHANQELEVYLQAFVDYYQDNWVKWLLFAEFAYNNCVNASIGMLLFYAKYIYNPTFSIDPVSSQLVSKVDA